MCRPWRAGWLQHIRILADDLLAQAQTEMQTCSVRRQNKVADRSSHNRCGTAVATAASVEILAKGNHHAFSSSKYFTKFVSILDCLETIFPMLATCELAIHPTRPHIPKQHQLLVHESLGADAALAMHGFQHSPGQSRGGGGPSNVNVILVFFGSLIVPVGNWLFETASISTENCEPSLVLVKPMGLLQLLDRGLLCIGGVTKIIQFSLFPFFPCFQSINQQAIPFLCAHGGAPIMHHSNGQYCNGLRTASARNNMYWMHYLSFKTYTLYLVQNVCF